MTPTDSRARWSNWAGNQTSRPLRIERPRTTEEIVSVVQAAAAANQTVKVVGAGHSFTAIARTEEVLISLDDFSQVMSIDRGRRTVTVQAGIRIGDLCERIAPHGLSLSNLGDIGYQSIAGAISTSTHGTGLRFQSIAASVVGLTLITGDGSLVACSADQHPEIFSAARVGLGALGILATVTIECVPVFNLHAREQGRPVGEVMEDFDNLARSCDHFEFFWMPNTEVAFTKQNNRTTDPPNQNRWKRMFHEEVLENAVFGATSRLGRARNDLIAPISRTVGRVWSTTSDDYIAPSHAVFTTPRRVRFYEMEYAVPLSDAMDAFERVREVTTQMDVPVSFPVEVRVLGSDDVPLSTATGRDSAYIAVHIFQGMDHTDYFDTVEAVMRDYGGRPHWGKLHGLSAPELAPLYPQWDAFQAARKAIDPNRRFSNGHLERIVGL